MYQAVVFDVDGTTVDTHFLVDAISETLYEMRGRRLNDQEKIEIYGLTSQDILRFLNIEPEEEEGFFHWFEFYADKFINRQKLFDGVLDTFKQLKENGIIVGINTSRTHNEVRQVADTLEEDFTRYCDYEITSDLVSSPKPAPDSLQLFSSRSGIPMENILFVGDSLFDSGCASNAGCDFVLATWGTSHHLPAQYYPDHPSEIVDIVAKS